jgi:hypothetical protein
VPLFVGGMVCLVVQKLHPCLQCCVYFSCVVSRIASSPCLLCIVFVHSCLVVGRTSLPLAHPPPHTSPRTWHGLHAASPASWPRGCSSAQSLASARWYVDWCLASGVWRLVSGVLCLVSCVLCLVSGV